MGDDPAATMAACDINQPTGGDAADIAEAGTKRRDEDPLVAAAMACGLEAEGGFEEELPSSLVTTLS